MVEIRNQIFTYLYNNLIDNYENITVTKAFDPSTAIYPIVTITQLDNNVYEASQDSRSNENHSRISFEINIYYNSASNTFSQSDEISMAINNLMAKLGFTRKSNTIIENYLNKVNRQIMRYTAIIDNNTFTTYRG